MADPFTWRALVVNANPDERKRYRAALKQDTLVVRTAEDLSRAGALLDAFRPNIVLLDLQKLGPTEAFLEHFHHPDLAPRPVVVLTSTRPAVQRIGEALPPHTRVATLRKPVTAERLLDTFLQAIYTPLEPRDGLILHFYPQVFGALSRRPPARSNFEAILEKLKAPPTKLESPQP